MSGWRIGYLITPPDLFKRCVEFQQITMAGVSEFVQEAAVATLHHLEDIMNGYGQILQHNRQLMGDFLNKLGIPFRRPQAAYYYFPNLSSLLTQNITNTTALAAYLKQEFAIEILPGEYFGAPRYARLSFALEEKELQEALHRLELAFTNLKPGKG